MSNSAFFDTTSFTKTSLLQASKTVEILSNYSIINFGILEESELLEIFTQTSGILLNIPLRKDNFDIEELLDIENAVNQYCVFADQLLRLLERIALCHKRRIDSVSNSWDFSGHFAAGDDILAELNRILKEYPKTDLNFLEKVYELISGICATVKVVHEKQYPSVSIDLILDAFRKYVSEDDGSTEKTLDIVRKNVRRRYERTVPIHEQWDIMLNDVLDAECLALNGKLVDDSKYDYLFSQEEKETMEKHFQIVSVVQNSSVDNKLFGFHYAANNHGLLSKLTSENMSTFFLLVHMENVLKCKIYSELKEKYERFITPTVLHDDTSMTSVNETSQEQVDPFQTKSARAIFEKLHKANYLDEHFKPHVSKPKAAIIGSVIADNLKLNPKWRAIENFWGIPDLATQLSRAQSCDYYDNYMKEIDKVLVE